jgi:hypothetical protein
MIQLTTNDSEIKINVAERNGEIVLYVNNNEIPFTRESVSRFGINFEDLATEIMIHGLPTYKFESNMLLDYAVDYCEAAILLSKNMYFKSPHLFNLGHSYELGMKAVIVLTNKVRLSSLYPKPGHNLVDLRNKVKPIIGSGLLNLDALALESFNSLYSEEFGKAKYFARYPDISHLYQKWPEQAPESIKAVTEESDIIIKWLYKHFNEICWGTRQRPNESMQRSRPQ